jgi:sulfatase maturation enzyme AslB (radical SAM superfamily)
VTCSGCQFASLCKGGCQKRVLEQDTAFMQETCDYWDHNIARFIRQLAEDDQGSARDAAANA